LAYAFRVVHLPLGLFGIALASAMLPSVSRSAARKDMDEFRKTVAHSLGLVLLLTLPSMLPLVILNQPIIGAIYQGGRFDAYDTGQTAVALAFYAIGLSAYAASRMLGSAFYALSDARTPMFVSLLGFAVNVGLPLLLIHVLGWGFPSLAITTSMAAIAECLALCELMRRRIGGLQGRYLFDRTKRIVAACLLVAVPMLVVSRVLANYTDATRSGYLVQLGACLPIMLLGMWFALRFLGAQDLPVVFQMFLRPVLAAGSGARAKLRG
jgi:putative peptidoglycan lipid II flippase